MVKSLIVALGVAAFGRAQMTENMRTQILAEHNAARRTIDATNMIELEYDMDLECAAQGYIDNLDGTSFVHNSNRNADYAACRGSTPNPSHVGENWYSGPPTAALDTFGGGAVNVWTDYKLGSCSERDNYAANHNDPNAGTTINPACAGGGELHFTQVMWAATRTVGCGYNQKWGTLCNYWTGQVQGQMYAQYGTACSACPGDLGQCNDGLCSGTSEGGGSQCAALPPITGFNVADCDVASAGETCQLTCATGFQGSAHTFTCTSAGQWTPAVSSTWCTPISGSTSCTKPTGTGLNTDQCGTTSGSTCTLYCNRGYVGSRVTLTCTNGQYTGGSIPTCSPAAKCAIPTDPKYVISTTPGQVFYQGETLVVKCANGSPGSTATCQANGQWSGLPACPATKTSCSVPKGANALPYDTSKCPATLARGQSCVVSCASGRNFVTASATVRCVALPNKSSGLTGFPSCNCKRPVLSAFHQYTSACPGTIPQNGFCNFGCGARFVPNTAQYKCTKEGWTLTPSMPVCVVKKITSCTKPTGPRYTAVGCMSVTPVGNSCTIRCNNNSRRQYSLICSSTGAWWGTTAC